MMKKKVQELLKKYECKDVEELKVMVEQKILFSMQKREWVEQVKWEQVRGELGRCGII